jgi:hypothetical protein
MSIPRFNISALSQSIQRQQSELKKDIFRSVAMDIWANERSNNQKKGVKPRIEIAGNHIQFTIEYNFNPDFKNKVYFAGWDIDALVQTYGDLDINIEDADSNIWIIDVPSLRFLRLLPEYMDRLLSIFSNFIYDYENTDTASLAFLLNNMQCKFNFLSRNTGMVTYWISLSPSNEIEESFLSYISYNEEDVWNDEDSIVNYKLKSEEILDNISNIIIQIMNSNLSLDNLINPDGNNNIQELKNLGLDTINLAEGIQIEYLGGKVVFKNDILNIEET